tara:strand:- start:831 stop:1208 length:378 start_codon:yes stop_codon:yes gene_type:complete
LNKNQNKVKHNLVKMCINSTLPKIKLNQMKKHIFDGYAKAIAEQFHLTLDQMFIKSKKREVVDARQMLYYLCMERPIRISYIQRFMEAQGHTVSHSTIIHGYKKAKEMIDTDVDYKEVVNKLQDV